MRSWENYRYQTVPLFKADFSSVSGKHGTNDWQTADKKRATKCSDKQKLVPARTLSESQQEKRKHAFECLALKTEGSASTSKLFQSTVDVAKALNLLIWKQWLHDLEPLQYLNLTKIRPTLKNIAKPPFLNNVRVD